MQKDFRPESHFTFAVADRGTATELSIYAPYFRDRKLMAAFLLFGVGIAEHPVKAQHADMAGITAGIGGKCLFAVMAGAAILAAVQAGSAAALAEIESSVDRAALTAFEVYMRCREQVWSIRNAEVKNLSVGIMERVAEWRARREAGEDAKRNQ